jgi:hypothetical protein
MNRFKSVLIAVTAVAVLVPAGAAAAHEIKMGITGYPNQINKVDLDGYVVVTSYPLGTNTGNTFQQTYKANGKVDAVGLVGPFTGQGFSSNYIAMPVAHKMLMVTWYLDNGTITDVFVMNFQTHVVSDVAPGPSPASLGSVQITHRGHQRIP